MKMNFTLQELYDNLSDLTKLVCEKWLVEGIINADVMKILNRGYMVREQQVKQYGIDVTGGMEKTAEYKKSIELFSEMPSIKKLWETVGPSSREKLKKEAVISAYDRHPLGFFIVPIFPFF
jgi:hypothetical protein